VTHLRQRCWMNSSVATTPRALSRCYHPRGGGFFEVLPSLARAPWPKPYPEYQVHLFRDRKLSPRTIQSRCAALRFLFVKTLRRPYLPDEIPFPKRPRKLPTVLSPEEVARLIDSARNLMHRTMLMTLYATGCAGPRTVSPQGLRHRQRTHGHSCPQGKGSRDRDVLLTPKLLETLREYWRWMKPKTYLFPGTVNNWRADVPITEKIVWEAVRGSQAGRHQEARISAHAQAQFRHAYAGSRRRSAHHPGSSRTSKLEHTTVYLHLSRRHLQAIPSPLEAIEVSRPDEVKRSRRLMKR
jgi:integrase/recombinase XerD